MEKPSFNLHSHTARCGHASGEDYEYVEAARNAGFTEMGFSDHVMLPGVIQDGIRGRYEELPGYIESVLGLKETFKDSIRIHLGMEAEWYGDRFSDYYRYLLSRDDFEFLILGQHCFIEDNCLHWYGMLPEEERLDRYEKDLIGGMESGLFTYVAHPDTYVRWQHSFTPRCVELAHNIATVAQRLQLPLEINCAPSRSSNFPFYDASRLIYPCPEFWKIVAKYDVPVVLGVDAHSPNDYAKTDYQYFLRFAQSLGLKLLRNVPAFPALD